MSKTNECKSSISVAEALRRKIQEEGKSLKDIDFIVVDGLGLCIKDFWNSAEQCDSSIENLKDEFKIVFKDGTWINKHYSRDGSVRLKYHKCPDKPVCILINPLPQEYLTGDI